MLTEQKELYFYTKNKFENELNKITVSCISPIIAIRQIVKKSMNKYIHEYCSNDIKIEEIFSQEDFQTVSNKIYNELLKHNR